MQHREAQRKRKEAMALRKRLEEAERERILDETEITDDETNYYGDDDDGGSGKISDEQQNIFRNNSNRNNDVNVTLHQIHAQDEGVLYTHTITVSRVGILLSIRFSHSWIALICTDTDPPPPSPSHPLCSRLISYTTYFFLSTYFQGTNWTKG
jgi:hypothetical protein